MTKRLIALVFVLLLCGPMTAWAAPDLTGGWEGSWTTTGYNPDSVEMVITSQVVSGSDYTITGYFDWFCTNGVYACSGRELFSGTLFSNSTFSINAYQLINPINLVLGTYWGTVSADGGSISGFGAVLGSTTIAGTWQVNKVPEPGTLALLGLGLAGLALARRRKQ